MRLLSLNLWGGKQGQVLLNYLKQESGSTDIFCFQEVFNISQSIPEASFVGRPHLLKELADLLPNFTPHFLRTSASHDLEKLVDFSVEGGQAIFIKNSFDVSGLDSTEIYSPSSKVLDPQKDNLPTVLQRAGIITGQKSLNIFNFHAVPFPGEKLDTELRLEQSKKILSVIAAQQGPKILCGDFNLMPQTQSISMFGQHMTDLIKEYKITNTRNELSWRQYHNLQYFADFTFVSPDIKVVNFEVPYNEVSDHLPMILEFDL